MKFTIPDVGYKLCSVKLLAFALIVIFILAMYHTLVLYLGDKLSGDNLVEIYRITLERLTHIFMTFVAGNVLSKPLGKKGVKNVQD